MSTVSAVNFQPQLDKLRSQISELVQQYAEIAHAPKPFVAGESVVPVSGKVIGVKELQLMVDASLDGWLTTGRFNAMFEERLAKFLGVKYLITVNSGSSANLVAFSTLTSPKLGDRAIKQGDEVIGVAAGFPTTVNPILQFGAVPVFVDVDLATHNIDASKIEAAITPKTKAIMLAHSLGNPFNLEVVTALCKKYNLWLVEDCCDALGATYNGQLVGTFGDIATLSFYPAHHITMGEGGAVFTNNADLKLIAESFRDWGRDCYCAPGKDNTCDKRFCWTKKDLGGDLPDGYDHKYTYSHLGYNLKISDMQAACALAQMDRVEEFIAKRRANFTYLKSRLASVEQFLHLPEATPNSEPSWFGFPLIVKDSAGVKRADLINFLEENKIGTRLLFAGNLTKQPYMSGRNFRVSGDLTNTDVVMNQTFWLGTFPGLGQEQLDYIVGKLEEFFGLNF
ncbi:lipopolysaccharide biosynthesis protein RfbH [Chromobacterium haemolyticum]|uniref:lipopolysaccharide biosynthesis protein RfbH n=1 Tax=Chromobacterium TaxID=535 RepID=UPI000693F3DA|nr:lipopolysaccharide biosynthesis protein RfbH [Chromobacterium haemolyticum]